jgi:catechol 2,3-dioxygenase-like lactoylglutathione lyase family enzyme
LSRTEDVWRFAATTAWKTAGSMPEVEFTAQLVIEVYVRDIDRSLHFYRALGFELMRQTGGFAVLSWAGHLLFLDEHVDLPDLSGRERANVRVMVPDVDALWQRVRALGAMISAPIADRYPRKLLVKG